MMNTGKPFVNVALMEFVYDYERDKFLNLLKGKASYVKQLDSQEYFERSDTDVLKAQKQVNRIRNELNTGFGFLRVADELKNSYECQLEKVYDAYNGEVKGLQIQLQNLHRENEILERLYTETIESLYSLMEILIKKDNGNDKN